MHTADIPGGTATIRDLGEMTAAGRRAVHVAIARIGRLRVAEILAADSLDTDDLADEVGLTSDEADAMAGIAAATSWAFLDGWTLPAPLPATPDAVLALPAIVREALDTATADSGAGAIRAEMSKPWRALSPGA